MPYDDQDIAMLVSLVDQVLRGRDRHQEFHVVVLRGRDFVQPLNAAAHDGWHFCAVLTPKRILMKRDITEPA